MLNFLGIGAQKAGTTWLHRSLAEHPRISFPSGKEVHFWDIHRSKGIDWYRGLFSKEDEKLQGEITPAYACLLPGTIEECHGTFPGLRLFYTLRNPIERAWSAANMALARAEMQIEEASDQWFADHLLSRGSIMRGDYEVCLKNWLRFYRQDQLLVLRFEELAGNPASYLDKCWKHLKVEPMSLSEESTLREPEFAGLPDPIRPSLLPILHEIYDEKIRSLQGFLGWDLRKWLE
jgi:hypothetical protein